MTSITSPQQQERRDVRYPLHLPVSIKFAHQEIRAHSEDISVRGILLSSALLIPEGSTVEVAVLVPNVPTPGLQLGARGKVLRVQPKASGNFAVAIAFKRPFRFGRQSPAFGEAVPSPEEHDRGVARREVYYAFAWHTET